MILRISIRLSMDYIIFALNITLLVYYYITGQKDLSMLHIDILT